MSQPVMMSNPSQKSPSNTPDQDGGDRGDSNDVAPVSNAADGGDGGGQISVMAKFVAIKQRLANMSPEERERELRPFRLPGGKPTTPDRAHQALREMYAEQDEDEDEDGGQDRDDDTDQPAQYGTSEQGSGK